MDDHALPKGNTVLSRDTRKILAVWFVTATDPELSGWQTGGSMCDRIEAYDELGGMSHVPWIAVFLNGQLQHRVPAGALLITYARDATCPHGHRDPDDCPDCRH